jgi:hypothetical protein
MSATKWEIIHCEASTHHPEAWGVVLDEPGDEISTAVFFGSKENAETFAAMGRAGADLRDLCVFVDQHVPFRPPPPSPWPRRSREELIALFEDHHPELCPLSEETTEQWLAHVEACGGYEGTALGEHSGGNDI